MSEARRSRAPKRQLGQFFTPPNLAASLVDQLDLTVESRVLEPGFGDGSFVLPLLRRFVGMRDGSIEERLTAALTRNLFGVELDPEARDRCLNAIAKEFGFVPDTHNLLLGDFLADTRWPEPPVFGSFTDVVGNPPFGGSFDPAIEDHLDRLYGNRQGQKIKKETYAFFVTKAIDLLDDTGNLTFLCSDSFLTINTMRGLRDWLLAVGRVNVGYLDGFSDEVSQPVVVLSVTRSPTSSLNVYGREVDLATVRVTPNRSWLVTNEYARYFRGLSIGDLMVATGGMTTGKNEYFVRTIVDGCVTEPFEFSFAWEPVTLERELRRARLNHLGDLARRAVQRRQEAGEKVRVVRVSERPSPVSVPLPHPDYRYYNKASSAIVFDPPKHAIYWKDEGDAVLTYKRSGNWYLRGVGGAPYFGREGITWALVASRLRPRYLPTGYILDSGAPVAVLRENVDRDELFVILGWSLTETATRILKNVINHTRNIQGKDFERLPYPWWLTMERKRLVIEQVRRLLSQAQSGETIQDGAPGLARLEELLRFDLPLKVPDHRETGHDGHLSLWDPGTSADGNARTAA